MSDSLGNSIAREGVDRCFCGAKYWENDKCVDCGTRIQDLYREQGTRIMDAELRAAVIDGLESDRGGIGDGLVDTLIRRARSVPDGAVIEEYDGLFDDATPVQEISLAIQQFDIGVL